MPALLVGNTNPKTILRSRCAAGHKAMWNAEWGGLPSQEFLSSLSPKFDGLSAKLYSESYTSDTKSAVSAPSGRRSWDCARGLR